MSAASEMQAKIDALLQTAPPPGPPSVPPSPEAVAIRKEAAGMYATLIALCAEDAPMQIKARNDLGKCLNDAGDLPGAIAVFEKARDDASAKGLHAMECKALMGLSFATARSRDLPGGIALMRQVLQVAEKLDAEGQDGRLEMELVALGHLSVLTVMGKQFDDATEVVARLCAAGKAKSERVGKATTEELLAQRVKSRLYFEMKDLKVAGEAARAVIALANGDGGLLAGGAMVENFEVPLAVKASEAMLKEIGDA